MKTYKTGSDREQLLLIQTSLDDKIASDNPVRVCFSTTHIAVKMKTLK